MVRLPALLSALNNEFTRLTGKIPLRPSKKGRSLPTFNIYSSPVRVRKKGSPPMQLCGTSTNPESLRAVGMEPKIRSGLCKSTTLKKRSPNPLNRFCIFLHDGPRRGFVREELLVVPATPSCRHFRDDIRSAPCECRPAAPSVCRNRCSDPASFVHRCTSPLHSFSFLC